MGLFKPAWKSKNTQKALWAVAKMTDQTKLARAARESTDWIVRRAAVEKLTDQTILADIAINDKVNDVRKTTVEKLTDQKLLADIAKNDNFSDVRKTAVEKLTDQTMLTDVAKNANNYDIRLRALQKIQDGETVKILCDKFVINMIQGKDWNSLGLLLEIAKLAPSVIASHWEAIRHAAIAKHTDVFSHKDSYSGYRTAYSSGDCHTDTARGGEHRDALGQNFLNRFPTYHKESPSCPSND